MQRTTVMKRARLGAAGLLTAAVTLFAASARADEGGVSFWVPGFFGSLAAAPLVPGWAESTIYYHTSVSAGADVALARQFQLGRVPFNLQASLSANLNARADLAFIFPNYTFATPLAGGQVTVGLLGAYGRVDTTLAGTLSGVLTTPLGPFPFARSDNINSTLWGFGDLAPFVTIRWNNGVHNYMVYAAGDIPVGAYDSTRLSNIGIGHGALDGGFGYTYFNPQTATNSRPSSASPTTT